MIFIVVKFQVKDEYVDQWLDITKDFTEATRAEPGNLWFDWNRSVDDPATFVLVEAFQDAAAGAAHVQSAHFRQGLDGMRPGLRETPRILNTELPESDWAFMGELKIDS
ncbi:putative quinol monooxygenase [Nocardia carnea]|uniref:putative quinol monooxygenase n=1 Tax=Nocardia carnea TaxID=37328 RepID=UPI002456D6B2|nr:putative quinol monooxygenase [Nocardia carnea]